MLTLICFPRRASMLDATAVMADVTGAEDEDLSARLPLWAEPERISFRMLWTFPSFSLFTGRGRPPRPRGSLSPLALAPGGGAIWDSEAKVWVFLPRPSPAPECEAGGLGGQVEVPSWMVSTVRRGCFLGRPRFLLGGAWTVRLSVLV